ncbi:DnaD domain-containing protein [Streptococcaceae bacterium ESL0687]|nr:DnaD domain-containing protein [Streptococcaceae bacterium ESL0687]
MSYFNKYRAGHIVLPHELLSNFHQLFANEFDFAVWLFFYENAEVAPSVIARALNKQTSEVNCAIKNLQEGGCLKVTIFEAGGSIDTMFDASYAFAKLDQVLAASQGDSKSQNLSDGLSDPAGQDISQDNSFRELLQNFESEMGSITPFQVEEIRNWVVEDKYDPNLIKLALREAVLNRKISLNYIRAILRNWRSEGIKTEADIRRKQDARALEASKQASKQPTQTTPIPIHQWKKDD